MLQRGKFERYVTAAEREEFLAAFVERALFIEPTTRSERAAMLRILAVNFAYSEIALAGETKPVACRIDTR